MRGDYVSNPGLYLAFSPSPVTPNDFTDAIAADPKQKLNIGQFTSTFDVMPNDHVTFRLEYGYRKSNVPYFASQLISGCKKNIPSSEGIDIGVLCFKFV